MERKKLLFLYNPRAGKGRVSLQLSDMLNIFVKAGYEVTVRPTQKYHDAYEYVRAFPDEYERIVCCGGDGTLDETVTGMMEREHKIPIGYIPAGSTNDFANSLQIPQNLLEAADNAVNGVAFPCDVGSFNHDIFVYVAAFGLFTDVSYETPQQSKNILGHAAYVLEGMKRLGSIRSYPMKVMYEGGIILEDEFAFGMVTNSRSVGGFPNMVNKQHPVFDDGLFEVTLIRSPKNALELQNIISALLIEQFDSEYMFSFQAGDIRFESPEEIAWTLDGEFGGSHSKVRVRDLKQSLTIMLPADKIHRVSQKYILEPDEDEAGFND